VNSKSHQPPQPWQNPRVIILLVLSVASGCGTAVEGPTRVTANGLVTFDGQPLENGTIRFIPSGATKGPKVSVAIDNGFFQFPEDVGPVAGHHRVEIEAPEAGELALDDEEAVERLRQQGRKPKIEVLRIPLIYNTNSRLTVNLTEAGPNDLTFELLSKSDKKNKR